MPVAGVPPRPAAVRRDGLHLGERPAIRAEAGQGRRADARRRPPSTGRGLPRSTVQLTFDPDVEAFRAEFVAFLDEHLPAPRPRRWSGRSRCRTCRHGRAAGSGCCSTTAGCCPAQPPEFGGRNATVLQQFVYLEELCKAPDLSQFQPAGREYHCGIADFVRHATSKSSAGRCPSCGPRSPPRWG